MPHPRPSCLCRRALPPHLFGPKPGKFAVGLGPSGRNRQRERPRGGHCPDHIGPLSPPSPHNASHPRSHLAPSPPAPSRQEMHLWHQVQVLPPREAAPCAAGGGRRAPRANAGLAERGRRAGRLLGRPHRPVGPPGARSAQPAPRAAAAGRGDSRRQLLAARPQRRLGAPPGDPSSPAELSRLEGTWAPVVPASPSRPAGWIAPRRLEERPVSSAARRPMGPPSRGRPAPGPLVLGRVGLGRYSLRRTFGVRGPGPGGRGGRARPGTHGALQHLPVPPGGQRHGPLPRALGCHQAHLPHPEIPTVG